MADTMERENAKIKGIINVGNSGINVQAYKDDIIKEYEIPDQYGKTKTVEFEDIEEEDGSRYTNYWVF